MKWKKQLRLDRRVPCTTGESDEKCVQLVLRSAPHPMDPTRSGAANGRPPVQIEDEAVLITEPATLLPHQITTRQQLSIELPAGTRHVKMETTKVWQYLPLLPPPPGPELP